MTPLRDVAVILLVIETMALPLIPAAVIGATWHGVRYCRRSLFRPAGT